MNYNSEELFNIGICYYNGSEGYPLNYEKAKEYLMASANMGNSDAMKTIGYMYEAGEGFRQDGNKAVEWYQRALRANPENYYAMICLADFYNVYCNDKEHKKQALNLYTSALKYADSLDAEWYSLACYNAGEIILNTFNNKKDSFPYFEEAAKVGNMPEAWHNMGFLVESGYTEQGKYYSSGRSRDQAALGYYLKGAKLNLPDSMCAAGRLYMKYEMQNDAVYYLEKAAGMGDEDAKKYLKRLNAANRLRNVADYIDYNNRRGW